MVIGSEPIIVLAIITYKHNWLPAYTITDDRNFSESTSHAQPTTLRLPFHDLRNSSVGSLYFQIVLLLNYYVDDEKKFTII